MMAEENSLIGLATPTRFLIENGEWNLTPSLTGSFQHEINPFDDCNYQQRYDPIKASEAPTVKWMSPPASASSLPACMPANAEYNANVTFNSSEPDLAKIKSPPTPLMSLSQSPGSSTTTSFTMNDLLVDIPNQQDNMTTEALGPSPTAYFDDEPTPRRRSNSTTRITRSVAASYDNTEDRGNSAKSIQSGRKRRIVFEGDDAEDRRKKFLERNRVAAYKCRQKKKNWMQDLEQKAELQNNQNEELRKLVAMLKEESMYLRNLLLTHGNCDCDSVQAYLRKQSAEITNNIVPSRRNSSEFSTMPSFSISPFTSSSATAAMPSLNEQSTGLTPFLDTVVNKGPQDPTDYFSTSHTEA